MTVNSGTSLREAFRDVAICWICVLYLVESWSLFVVRCSLSVVGCWFYSVAERSRSDLCSKQADSRALLAMTVNSGTSLWEAFRDVAICWMCVLYLVLVDSCWLSVVGLTRSVSVTEVICVPNKQIAALCSLWRWRENAKCSVYSNSFQLFSLVSNIVSSSEFSKYEKICIENRYGTRDGSRYKFFTSAMLQ